MQIREIMTESPVVVVPDDPIITAARLMREHDTGFIPVVQPRDNQQLAGVITDRDLAIRVVAEGVDAQGSTVGLYMTAGSLHCVPPDTETDAAAALMADRQVHRLCVVENDRFIGVVSLGDLAVTHPDAAEEALEGISHGARAQPMNPTEGEEDWYERHPD